MEKTVGKNGTSLWLKKHGLNTVLVAPLMIFVFSFTIVPIFQTILLSFKDQITSEWTLRNYVYVFGRSFFSEAVINTLFVSAIGLLIQMVIGYLLASMLRKNFVGKGLARTLVMLPMGIPTMVSGVAMLYLFGMSGYLNEILYRLNVTPIPIDWTANRLRSLFVVAVADSWKVMPMVVMLFLSGLESIPLELYEAADVDGAGKFDCFRYITIPQLKATVTMTVLTRLVDLLRIFELPKVLLGGTTPFLATMSYEEYSYGNNAYSAVASTVLLALILVIVMAYMFAFEREKKGGGRR
ncbi:carbohydrate ABC transporter permease [Enterocloster asparagiformis]|uniref:carbohydrate ABC transporter permease n=1 Tax=Enterocloster asparagiformis TaxID=333367 RepID=UPI0004652324|nr:sugar ABC transporter permease [Enterocloster asparagiformis]